MIIKRETLYENIKRLVHDSLHSTCELGRINEIQLTSKEWATFCKEHSGAVMYSRKTVTVSFMVPFHSVVCDETSNTHCHYHDVIISCKSLGGSPHGF
jgi:hypothetical protein